VAVRSAGLPTELVAQFALPGLDANTRVQAEEVCEVTTAAVRSALLDDRFLAALCWQNPVVVTTWAARLAAEARAGREILTSRRNERERVVSRYVQRYCTKNESIGFFGPVAWARFTGDAEDLRYTGDLGLRSLSVLFETWAVAALADAWRDDPEVFPQLPVRLNPAASLVGGQLIMPRRGATELRGPDRELAAALSPGIGCGALVTQVANTTGEEEKMLAGRLEELSRSGVLQVGLNVPFCEHPEQHLRVHLNELPSGPFRSDLLARLDRVTEAAEKLRAVALHPNELLPSLQALENEFVAAGGAARRTLEPQERGRTAVYVDCRRDLDVRLGAPLLDKLRAPLGLLLDSARWLAAEIGAAAEAHLAAQYRTLRRRGPVNLADLQLAGAHALVPGGPVAREVFEDFQLRWSELLPGPSSGTTSLPAAELRPMVDALFPRRMPMWAAARRHSPDLMLMRHPDGRLQWVLGELHVAMNTLESRVFLTQSDDPDGLVSATDADFPGGRIVPVYPIEARPSNTRTYPPPALDPPGRFRYWSFGPDRGHETGACSLPATSVQVEEREGRLIGLTDSFQAPVLEFFGEFLTAVAVNLFQLRRPQPRLPRLMFDDVIVLRESWRVPAPAVPLPASRSTDYSYAELRSWAAGQGMPRHCFVTLPGEPKPVYVDFAAPALLDNLARLVRRAAGAADITVTEMLPAPGQLWLTDPAGAHFTAEFRIVAVDQQPQDQVCTPPVPARTSPGAPPDRLPGATPAPARSWARTEIP